MRFSGRSARASYSVAAEIDQAKATEWAGGIPLIGMLISRASVASYTHVAYASRQGNMDSGYR